ncbi:MAG: phosphate signaling complex protein PhoU [Rhodospirillaceae bacterium]|nr:phosphate signaling complex protein PhoU [Rhodospirillaceae bacterium]MBT3627300.1 phosphate signaling complex protein PhoU [Rhodospirillaceae bacterium]MBT3928632.1 phosphate signaling complex protein PhoU [Rhodospirillaceae bacterium]MBT5037834.1 phosphate signaling complex protein PhoU [Rhodospirillaceae bacterium]MBT5676415.1 phosphate signaling complex protein PhoU [Rhodospirillaceae bacterium]
MPEHTVKSYDEELNQMTGTILRMGGMVEQQLAEAITALVKRDPELAARVIQDDKPVDRLEHEVDHLVMRLLALRQPMAVDLRLITASLKISSDLERIGDYAANVAKRAGALSQVEPMRPVVVIPRMSLIVQGMIKDVLDAYMGRDVDKALDVWRRDEEVDEIYNSLFRELLTYMMEDPRHITPCTHLLFIAKNIERMGDHATNIAETISFLVTGTPLDEVRPKGDKTPFTTTPADLQDTGSEEV